MTEIIYESKIDQIQPGLVRKLIRQLNLESRWLQGFIKEQHMSGPTSETSIGTRTGALRASVMPIKAEIKGESVEAGVSMGGNVSKGGTPAGRYARVQIGPAGRMTTIRPKSKKFLTIPLKAAMTGAGVSKGPATSKSLWGDTFVAKSKAGNLIIFGKERYTKGKRTGEMRGKIVPLFLLKTQVSIPARVHTDEIVSAFSLKVMGDMKGIGVNIIEG